MLMFDGLILGRDLKDEILIDGLNVYEPSTIQYCFYTLTECSDEVRSKLNIEKGDENNKYLIFPFQSGIQFTPNYHILHIKDCLGVVDKNEFEKLYKGEY